MRLYQSSLHCFTEAPLGKVKQYNLFLGSLVPTGYLAGPLWQVRTGFKFPT